MRLRNRVFIYLFIYLPLIVFTTTKNYILVRVRLVDARDAGE